MCPCVRCICIYGSGLFFGSYSYNYAMRGQVSVFAQCSEYSWKGLLQLSPIPVRFGVVTPTLWSSTISLSSWSQSPSVSSSLLASVLMYCGVSPCLLSHSHNHILSKKLQTNSQFDKVILDKTYCCCFQFQSIVE